MERTYQEVDGKKHYDITLKHMGYDLYIPYSQSVELMDVIEKGVRAMENDKSEMQRFIRNITKLINDGEMEKDLGKRMIEDRLYSIEKIDKHIDIGYIALSQMNVV